jgi:DNA helicase-2/ATP-dependent DNA helicase PcrA
MPPAEVLEAVLDRTGYLKELAESPDPQDESRVENLSELVGVAREFEERVPDGGVLEFMEQVSLVADADQIPDADGTGGVVTLMTLHAAKGLEYPIVFLTGLEDGVFPHLRTLGDPAELQEERRLAYVGITRAREKLYVSRAHLRMAWGQTSYNPPSRFLEELPEHLMDWRRVASTVQSTPALSRAADRVVNSGIRARSAPGLRAIPNLEVGDRVTHDAFGLGTVTATKGAGDQSQAEVDFGGGTGSKWLLLRYAPVVKL